jgi:hypothetical protein
MSRKSLNIGPNASRQLLAMANKPKSTALVWFGHDLRLADNHALTAAIETGLSVIPVFIWSPEEEGKWPAGGASQWWLHQSLTALQNSLRSLQSNLIIRRGHALETLLSLAAESNATHIFWNHRYEPHIIERNRKLKGALQQHDFLCQSFNGGLLFEPWTIHTTSGSSFKVFTPFWRACLAVHRCFLSTPLVEIQLHPLCEYQSSFMIRSSRFRGGTSASRKRTDEALPCVILLPLWYRAYFHPPPGFSQASTGPFACSFSHFSRNHLKPTHSEPFVWPVTARSVRISFRGKDQVVPQLQSFQESINQPEVALGSSRPRCGCREAHRPLHRRAAELGGGGSHIVKQLAHIGFQLHPLR